MTDRRIGLLPPTKAMEEYKGQIDGPDGVTVDDLDKAKEIILKELGIISEENKSDRKTPISLVKDEVNNPSHYTSGKIEVIDAIEDWKLGLHLGNVVKYVARAGKKDPDKFEEDIKKAQWYLNRYIELEFES